MPIPGTAVRTVEGRLTTVCEATGTSPVYVALMWNSIVLVNETNNAVTQLYLEGNYHCIATNNYGTDTRVIPVFLISKGKMSVPCRDCTKNKTTGSGNESCVKTSITLV